jgi:hypothetical protein
LTPIASFALAFGVTLIALGVVVWSGLRARRGVHVPAVGFALAALGATIFCAYRLGHTLDLESAGIITPIHLTLARAATIALLVPVVLGIRTLFVPATRAWHARAAWFALALVVAAAITGVIMLSRATHYS